MQLVNDITAKHLRWNRLHSVAMHPSALTLTLERPKWLLHTGHFDLEINLSQIYIIQYNFSFCKKKTWLYPLTLEVEQLTMTQD